MIKINKKSINEHNNELINLFNNLSITNKYNIVGSFSTQGIYFPSDVDLNENIKIKSQKDIISTNKKLQKVFKYINDNKNIFFTDFKIGVDENNESLHWTFDEIMKGKKNNKHFNESLLDGTVKLDIIYRLNFGDFVEISMIYQINPKKLDLVNDLKNDIKEYLKIGRSYKALKRCFSLYTIQNNHKKLYILMKLFNTDIGLVAKVISEITIYIQLLELYSNRISIKEIDFSIQELKYYLGCIFRFKIPNKIFQKLDKICQIKTVKKLIIELNKMNDYFKKLLEEQTNIWLTFNKNIIPF